MRELFGDTGVYKIGYTDCLRRRIKEHQWGLDQKIERRVAYHTPLPGRRLEKFLHLHFNHYQVRKDLKDELFDLPQEAADGFEAVAKAIERHLLAVEVLRLEARLLVLKEECP